MGIAAVNEVRIELLPMRIGPKCEVAHHPHAGLVAEFDHLAEEVRALESGGDRGDVAGVPGIAVVADTEGLDGVGPEVAVPADMFGRVGVGVGSRRRCLAAGPVKVDAKSLDRLGPGGGIRPRDGSSRGLLRGSLNGRQPGDGRTTAGEKLAPRERSVFSGLIAHVHLPRSPSPTAYPAVAAGLRRRWAASTRPYGAGTVLADALFGRRVRTRPRGPAAGQR